MAEHDDNDWTGVPDDVDELLARMREAGLQIEHSFFGTIHQRSDKRPDGWTPDELGTV